MNQEHLSRLKRELSILGMVVIIAFIGFQIVFFRQDLLTNVRVVLSLAWLYVLPGYGMLYYWHKELGLAERLVVGTVVGLAVMSIASYYLGLVNIAFNLQIMLLPVLVTSLSLYLGMKR